MLIEKDIPERLKEIASLRRLVGLTITGVYSHGYTFLLVTDADDMVFAFGAKDRGCPSLDIYNFEEGLRDVQRQFSHARDTSHQWALMQCEANAMLRAAKNTVTKGAKPD